MFIAFVLLIIAPLTGGRILAAYRGSLRRTLAFAASGLAVGNCIFWYVLGKIQNAERAENFAALKEANPGKSLSELAPGYSMLGMTEGLPFLFCVALILPILAIVIFPPRLNATWE